MRVLLALSLIAAACVSPRVAATPQSAGIPTRIENHSSCDVRVRVYEESTLILSERVTSQTSVRVRLRPLEVTHALRFVVEPFSCGPAYAIGTLSAIPPALVVLVEATPNLSTVRGEVTP